MGSLDQLIPIINKLQDVFNTLETEPVDLPQIVVRLRYYTSGSSSQCLVGAEGHRVLVA